jgi:hypothetical protein
MKLLTNSRRGAAVVLAMASLFIIPAVAPGKAANPGLIPSKPAYVISIPDLPGFWKAWKTNAIYSAYKKVIASSDVASEIAPLGKEVETIEKALGFKLDGDTASQIFKSVDLYLIPGENAGSPTVGLIVNTADKQKLEKLIDLAEKAAASAAASPAEDENTTSSSGESKETSAPLGGGAGPEDTQTSGPVSTETYKDVTVKKFAGGENREVYYAMLGDVMVASTEPSEIKALIDRSKGGAEAETLAGSADYKKSEAGLSGQTGELYVFMNHEKAMEFQSSLQGIEALTQLLQKFAPSVISNTSVKFEPKQVIVYTYSPFREGEDGAAGKALYKKYPADKPLEIAGFAPAKCLLVGATNLVDAKMIQQYISSIMGVLGGVGATGALDEQVKGFELQMGFSLKDDLVPAVGNEAAFMLNSVQMGGLFPNVDAALVVKVADKDKMKKVLAGVEKFAGATLGAVGAAKDKTDAEASGAPALKTATVGNTTVKYVELPAIPGYSPAFALTGDYLVIATSKDSISGLLDVKAGKSPSLVGSEPVKSVAPRVNSAANNFSFANLQEIWSTVGTIAEKFPVGETVAKVVDVLKVFKAAGSSEKATGDAVISQMVVVLN